MTVGTGEAASASRVLFVIAGLPAGGAERQLALLLRGLDRCAFEPGLLIFNRRDKIHYREVFEGLGWFRALALSGRGSARFLWPILSGVAQAVRDFGPDVVCTTLNVANHAVRTSQLLFRWRTPIVTSVRADFRRAYRLRERLAERLLWRRSDYIVCNSPAIRDDMMTDLAIPASRIGVVANGLDPVFFETPSLAPPAWWPDGRTALVIGRFSPEKNHFGLIEGLSEIDREGKLGDWRFVFVGEGSLEGDIRSAVSASGLVRRILLHPPVPDPWRLYHVAALVIIPSLFEGMPNVALEAQAAACPVAISTGANRAGVVDKDGGFILDRDLRRSLIEVLSSPDEELKRRGATARRRVIADFSSAAMVQSMQRILHQVCGKDIGFETAVGPMYR